MKILDYFNICFIVFVILCILFVLNNEYKLNLENFFTEFESATSDLYRIINKIGDDIYCLCRVDIYEIINSKGIQKKKFFIFDKYNSEFNVSCLDHTVKYGESDPNPDDPLFFSIESTNLKGESNVNKFIYGLIKKNFVDGRDKKIENFYFKKTFGFKFKKLDEDNNYNITDIDNNNIIEYDDSNEITIIENTVDRNPDTKKMYILRSESGQYMINKTNYKDLEGQINNESLNLIIGENIKFDNFDLIYEMNKNLFLKTNILCSLKNKILSKNLKSINYNNYKNNSVSIQSEDSCGNKGNDSSYDNTTTVKKDFMCPKDYPYPFDEWIDQRNKEDGKYRYDIVKSRTRCCSVPPTLKKNTFINKSKNGKEDPSDYKIKDDERAFFNINENQGIYSECADPLGVDRKSGIPCQIDIDPTLEDLETTSETGKCNIFNIANGLCIDENILKDNSGKVFKYDDKIIHPAKIIDEFKLSERMTFYIRPYYCSGIDSQVETHNIEECLPF